MQANKKIFADNPAVATSFASDFVDWLNSQTQDRVTVSLSGGSTPTLLFKILAEQFADKTDWSRVHFFWGDERCVPPEDPQSNYGVCKSLFLDHVAIPDENVHRVIGESDPEAEAVRYGEEMKEHCDLNGEGLPVLDLLILGMGGDGHTASIFPHQIELLKSEAICAVATHPESGQKRVSMTGPVLNAAKKIDFLVTGAGKANVLAEIFGKTGAWETYPTSFIKSAGPVTFYLDEAAASKLG
jgi:6-phosphogluconolactonase